MKFIKILNILSILLHVKSSFSGIESVNIYQNKQGKKIVILGSNDTRSLERTPELLVDEAEDYRYLLRLILQMSQSQGNTPSTKSLFYIIFGYESLEKYSDDNCSEFNFVESRIALFANVNGFKIKNIDFRLNKNAKEFLSRFFEFVENCLTSVEHIKLQKKLVFPKWSLEESQTFDEFLQDFQKMVDDKQNELSKLDYGFVWVTLLQNRFNTLREMLKKYDSSKPYRNVLVEAIYNSKPLDISTELKMLQDVVDSLYYDLIKLDQLTIMVDQDSFNYDTVVLLIDQQMVAEFDRYLTKIYDFNTIVKEDDNTLSYKKLEEIFNLDKQYSKLSNQELENLISPLNINNKCAKCPKYNCKNMCGKCKAVYYCSAECQKADWPKHKKKCNISKQK